MLGTNNSTFLTLKIDLSDHPFIKDDIFEANVNYPPRGTPIGIIAHYCEHHNVSYNSQSKNNSQSNHAFPARNSTNFYILVIGIKEPTTSQKDIEGK